VSVLIAVKLFLRRFVGTSPRLPKFDSAGAIPADRCLTTWGCYLRPLRPHRAEGSPEKTVGIAERGP
jgi:hypothetical protein